LKHLFHSPNNESSSISLNGLPDLPESFLSSNAAALIDESSSSASNLSPNLNGSVGPLDPLTPPNSPPTILELDTPHHHKLMDFASPDQGLSLTDSFDSSFDFITDAVM
jgi:hypothetical protein